ncbi:microvitellogenin-like [Manduca sexta]|uniref:microvitellogenin-like n=1 Tax=Manduca sexta TaxID=7130 RepID=UPI00188F09BA|nr:microvitellogenin-like [Manduca sexta]
MLRITLLLTLVALACHAAPSSDDAAVEPLYRSVTIADYKTALSQSKSLVNRQKGRIISKTVDKLINENPKKVMYFAYYLWNNGAQDIVKNYFPLPFRVIFSQLSVELYNKKYSMELKVTLSTDSDNERGVYGDYSKVGARADWTFMVTEAADEKVYFKVYNPSNNQYMKSGNSADGDNDRPIYASTNSDTFRHQWYLEPVMYNGDLLFYIFNREYNQPLKLGQFTDSDGDRRAYAHGGDPSGDPERFGWKMVRY